jgi:hypothetical protein
MREGNLNHVRIVEAKASTQHNYGAQKGRACIAPTHSRPLHYMGVNGQPYAPAAFTPWERTHGTQCTGVWVGRRAGLDTEVREKISCFCRGSNLDICE